ncbi:MAG TPA: transposase [Verrucomicrobiae bacterium]|jgi:REP element-mobilizing transposase RayT
MARKLRVQYPGAIYHVLSRGDRREAIFKDDTDREMFLQTLEQACEKAGWQVHAWVLMSNHFHLVIETPGGNLVAGMKWLLGTYTSRFNRRHKEFGHLFSGRYKALIVDGSGDGYLKTVCDYVHLNAARAGLLGPRQRLASYRWSSLGQYLSQPGRRPRWLRVDRLLGEWRIPKDSPAGRRMLGEQMERRRWEGMSQEFKPIERGWCLGGEEFKRELLEQVSRRAGPGHKEPEVREAAEAKAQRLAQEGLARLGWGEAELEARRKGDPAKVDLAAELRRQTTMTLRWIAQRLRMGTTGHLAHLLYWKERNEKQ